LDSLRGCGRRKGGGRLRVCAARVEQAEHGAEVGAEADAAVHFAQQHFDAAGANHHADAQV
jgi:hypothetical protein